MKELKQKIVDAVTSAGEPLEARTIAERTSIDLVRLRPILTTMSRENMVRRETVRKKIARVSKNGKQSIIDRDVNVYFI